MDGSTRGGRWSRFAGSVTEYWSWLTNNDFDLVEARPDDAGTRSAESGERARERPERSNEEALTP